MKTESVPVPDLLFVLLENKDEKPDLLTVLVLDRDYNGAWDVAHDMAHSAHNRCVIGEKCKSAIFDGSKNRLVSKDEIADELMESLLLLATATMKAWGFHISTPNLPGIPPV